MGKKILYISYDGMTDPLGQSQVLPYIVGLSKLGYEFTLISCEKMERFEQNADKIKSICKAHDINWQPLPFTTFPPVISKLQDKNRIRKLALELQQSIGFDMVHCRSYIAADIGNYLKKKFGVKLFFDMRGFWVDERIDGGIWNLRNPFFRFAYKYYKNKEQEYIRNSDHIISLTEAAVQEIKKWEGYEGAPFSVIPCSADFELFELANTAKVETMKEKLDIMKASKVISYLGSVGTWYLLDEMLLFFRTLLNSYPDAIFLLVTPEKPESIFEKAASIGIEISSLRVVFSPRDMVPDYLSVSDFSLSFIKPAYSKIASSPTKLGELFAMGIPVVTNGNVGDVEQIVNDLGGGIVINEFSEATLTQVVDRLDELKNIDRLELRKKASEYYNLRSAVEKYSLAYQSVFA